MNKRYRYMMVFSVVLVFCILVVTYLAFDKSLSSGPSMNPTIENGSCLWKSRFESTDQNLTGRIISFQYNETDTACHRVIEDNGEILVTQGDNPETNAHPDKPISRNQITGIVSFIFPNWFIYLDYLLFFVGDTLFLLWILGEIRTDKK